MLIIARDLADFAPELRINGLGLQYALCPRGKMSQARLKGHKHPLCLI